MIELLVVIAIIAILAAMLLPALSKAKIRTQGIGCMNNTRQLTFAWRMYAEDNRDVLPFAYGTDPTAAPYVWVPGYLDDANPSAPENWNLDITIRRSILWSYCGNSVGIWRCPADTSYGINNLGQRECPEKCDKWFAGTEYGVRLVVDKGHSQGWNWVT